MNSLQTSPTGFATRTPQRLSGAAIHAESLTKSFGAVHAVRGIDLEIRSGEIVALLGPNGAGKTTTIDMILGLAAPDDGAVRVFGLDPTEAISYGLVSAVMQTGGLLKDLTIRETVAYVASLFPSALPVPEVLEIAGLTSIEDRMVSKCSGGEQQRLRFAMALVSDPQLLILDEPTTGMDVNTRRAFWAAIRADAARGRTIVFATHYLEEADAFADRIVLMREGVIVADGTSSQIKGLGSTRKVTARLPGADTDAVAQLPGVSEVDQHGETIVITAADSDVVARYLLTETAATDLEIAAQGLEEAFITLTTASPAASTPLGPSATTPSAVGPPSPFPTTSTSSTRPTEEFSQ